MRYWLPPLLWAAVILAASSDLLSSAHTGTWLAAITERILGRPMQPAAFDTLHAIIRKGGHLFEYGILGGLWFRAVRRGRTPRWRTSWAATAVALSMVIAGIDEWRQTFVPSRTGAVSDVLLDTVGASIAQILIRIAAHTSSL